MDPLSQGVLGVAAPKSVAPPEHARIAALFGFLAGMAPDLDVFIRSSTDPLLFLEYHRQFTHALVFIPVGGLLCGWLLHLLFGKRRGLSLRRSIFYSTLGYATHALLDACTTYGTQLFWPFSDTRIAWNTVSVIDPLFTLPILLLIVVSVIRRNAVLARIALAWAVAYPVIGLVQRDRAEAVGWERARSRGHEPLHLEAKPASPIWFCGRLFMNTMTTITSTRSGYWQMAKSIPATRCRSWTCSGTSPGSIISHSRPGT